LRHDVRVSSRLDRKGRLYDAYIAAAHAGWRGALLGIIEATVASMERLGAKPERVVAIGSYRGFAIKAKAEREG
jgi:copper oxidase (laccase) domain-containing protein